MTPIRAAAFILVATGLVGPVSGVSAATVVPYGGVGQHATVMNNIAQAQQRNNAAIRRVQNNIRANRPRTD